jgi:NAD(P)-dependent dehydrogenase (short-subunit alcohol dehydrogenase family)
MIAIQTVVTAHGHYQQDLIGSYLFLTDKGDASLPAPGSGTNGSVACLAELTEPLDKQNPSTQNESNESKDLQAMNLRVLITGASRGLGLEFVRQYLAEGARVFAAARSPHEGALSQLAAEHPQQLSPITLDVTDDEALETAVDTVRAQTNALDLLINNAGINPRNVRAGHYTSAAMLEVLHANAVAPILIGQAFLELLRHGTNPKLINISSQVGSFTWNTSGSSPFYAASKAALNMYTRAVAAEAIGVITVAVHPGWVQTDMGGKQAPLTPAQSVRMLRALIERLTPASTGRFLNYDGQPHPY